MKCTRQPRFLANKPVKITNVLEVHLSARQWQTIVRVARRNRRTYSTIVRYCVFRLARKCHLEWTPRLRKGFESSRLRISTAREQGELHRHRMCLYGEDEKLIRLVSMALEMTISAFIRLALELYLDALAVEKHSKRYPDAAVFVSEAIRFIESICFLALNGGPFPALRELHCSHWELESYW